MKWDQVGQVGHGISTALLKIRQSGIKPERFFLFILGLNDSHQICGLGSDCTQKL